MAISPPFASLLNHCSSGSVVNKMRNSPPPPSIRLLPYPTNVELKSIKPKTNKEKRSTTTDVLRLMDSLQLPIQADTYVSLLKECTDSRDALRGAEVHYHIQRGSLIPRIIFANRLLLMYVVCGELHAAHHLFDRMPARNPISWAILIFGHAENDDHQQVLRLFLDSIRENDGLLEPIASVIVSVIKACTQCCYFQLGKQVHGRLWKMGFTKDMLLASSLVSFYVKFGCLESARKVFDQMPRRGSIIWTSMIVGYCREDRFNEVLQLFEEMGRAGKRKNNFTFSSVLRACGRMQDDGRNGRQVHAQAIKAGVESNSFVQSSLVDMYGKCGLLPDATRAFEMIAERDMVSWNAMLTGYTNQGLCNEAIKLLYEMKACGIELPESMVNQVRIACGS
ncbi:pentatricopeptide repeat-containing protein At1g31790 [Magnolia sinica]|uniref:pentatricopeptide repeat-containing protein At1g31790 n=1 Tax=Magnolia sinica TaxID=86752 RepID=UPI00265B6F89|nr:pentatricopeptide repeat-containing protein At1g31790 [Magnolia sinica]